MDADTLIPASSARFDLPRRAGGLERGGLIDNLPSPCGEGVGVGVRTRCRRSGFRETLAGGDRAWIPPIPGPPSPQQGEGRRPESRPPPAAATSPASVSVEWARPWFIAPDPASEQRSPRRRSRPRSRRASANQDDQQGDERGEVDAGPFHGQHEAAIGPRVPPDFGGACRDLMRLYLKCLASSRARPAQADLDPEGTGS